MPGLSSLFHTVLEVLQLRKKKNLTLEKFTLFSRLPKELQLGIWERAFPVDDFHAILDVEFNLKGWSHETCTNKNCVHGDVVGFQRLCDKRKGTRRSPISEAQTGINARLPAMYFACKDARQTVLKHRVVYLHQPDFWMFKYVDDGDLQATWLDIVSPNIPKAEDFMRSILLRHTVQHLHHLAIPIEVCSNSSNDSQFQSHILSPLFVTAFKHRGPASWSYDEMFGFLSLFPNLQSLHLIALKTCMPKHFADWQNPSSMVIPVDDKTFNKEELAEIRSVFGMLFEEGQLDAIENSVVDWIDRHTSQERLKPVVRMSILNVTEGISRFIPVVPDARKYLKQI